jgi:hypothetical protein
MHSTSILFVTLISSISLVAATFINNLEPRYDINGEILDSHDFSLYKYPGHTGYYMISVAYGECKEPANLGCDQTSDKCGFQFNHTVNVWRSTDLSSGSWEFISEAISPQMRPAGTLYRPDAIYNPNTNNVVLWHNWVHVDGTYAGYAAYTAPDPQGPYTLQRNVTNVTVNNSTSHCGDFHLFIDPVDNTPYAIMGCDFHMYIERLLPNALDSALDVTPTGRYMFEEYFIEAPELFVRNGVYYAVFGHCCCYCYQGSGAIVHTAPHPLGPWTTLGDVACVPTTSQPLLRASQSLSSTTELLHAIGFSAQPTPGQGCQYVNASTTSSLRSQQSAIFEVDTPNGKEWIWAGDRWQQSPDGTKAHDPQLWVPIVFNEDDSIAPLRWLDNFTMDIV